MHYLAGVQKSNEQTLVKKVDMVPEMNSVYHPYAWVLYVLGANLL